MSDLTRKKALAHFGVRGQKWGVRKQKTNAQNQQGLKDNSDKFSRHPTLREGFAPKGTPKEDIDWAVKSVTTTRINRVAPTSRELDARAIQIRKENPKFKDIRKEVSAHINRDEISPRVKEWFAHLTKDHQRILDERSLSEFGVSPSKKNRLKVQLNSDNSFSVKITPLNATKVKESDLDEFGRNIRMSDLTQEDSLAHFGIKGQKWGIRNKDGPSNSQIKGSRKILRIADKHSDLDIKLREGDRQKYDMLETMAETRTTGEKYTKRILIASGAVAVTALIGST